MRKIYRSSEVQKIVGISKMQAVHWTQIGIVEPLQDAHGRGKSRLYSHENLFEFMICRELARYAIETRIMKKVIDEFRLRLEALRPSSEKTSTEEDREYAKVLGLEDDVEHRFLVIAYHKKSGFFINILISSDLEDISRDFFSTVNINLNTLFGELP